MGKNISLIKFKYWNYKNTIKLVKLKSGLISREGYFLNYIAEVFTPYYQLLKLWVNRLWKIVFLINKRWEKEDKVLYF